jgi:hypothetical protein
MQDLRDLALARPRRAHEQYGGVAVNGIVDEPANDPSSGAVTNEHRRRPGQTSRRDLATICVSIREG